jgi:inosine kinase
MRFPGKRKSKHFFPVSDRGRIPFQYDFNLKGNVFVVGLDQPLVDIEAHVTEEFLKSYQFTKGESQIINDDVGMQLLEELKDKNVITGQYAGGAIGNTLHNFSTLSESESILLGVISRNITIGDDSFKYLITTSCLVDLSYLKACDGPIGKAICLVTPDGERTFGICPGKVNDYYPEFIPQEVLSKASLLIISAYYLRDPSAPIFKATMRAVEIAKRHHVPIVLSLGTSGLVKDILDFLVPFIEEYVNVLAMNQFEALALTGHEDPLLGAEKVLDMVDLCLITVGKDGLFLGAHVEESLARQTHDKIQTGGPIPDFNRYEYSRAMLKKSCQKPIKIYGHINPYMGGPGTVENTNGAGDAALAALLHDMVANDYHKEVLPTSPKHTGDFLTYSSISQICKYANRVSFEVLRQKSPRLVRGLPEKEDVLEESYWDR